MATAGRGKGGKARAARRAAPQVLDAPLQELSRDQLSVFLYVALLPDETKALVKELRLEVPGFRAGSLGDVERCDVIADEIRDHPPSAAPVLATLAKAFGKPPFAATALGTEGADELLGVGGGDAALALSLWRVLSDAEPEVRKRALPLLDDLARHYFGEPGNAPAGREPASDGEERKVEQLAAALEAAERQLRESREKAEARLEEVRRKGEERHEKAQAALREARARESQAVEDAARAREESGAARQELARVKGDLDALRAADAVAEAARARAEAKDLLGRLGSVEGRLDRAREREQELEAEVERLRGPAGGGVTPAPESRLQANGEPDDAGDGETWLRPVYTREFYDSIEGWDRRIQRAAFKQAHLLAQDHRHPSLRALPLEGLPGYYRVRVATDVRLIYRRAERQNEVEILSLIDREDLDRYIRQAKTRG
jgi:mRNA-degrading endonuclease RelE of RelBE toxin-antitoxin system